MSAEVVSVRLQCARCRQPMSEVRGKLDCAVSRKGAPPHAHYRCDSCMKPGAAVCLITPDAKASA